MSTDYYLACDKCKEVYHIGQYGWKFFSFYSGEPRCMAGISDFIEKHAMCDGNYMTVKPESKIDDYMEIEWPDFQGRTKEYGADGPIALPPVPSLVSTLRTGSHGWTIDALCAHYIELREAAERLLTLTANIRERLKK